MLTSPIISILISSSPFCSYVLTSSPNNLTPLLSALYICFTSSPHFSTPLILSLHIFIPPFLLFRLYFSFLIFPSSSSSLTESSQLLVSLSFDSFHLLIFHLLSLFTSSCLSSPLLPLLLSSKFNIYLLLQFAWLFFPSII